DVVFPAPLGPNKPTISPWATSKETSFTTVRWRYFLMRCSAFNITFLLFAFFVVRLAKLTGSHILASPQAIVPLFVPNPKSVYLLHSTANSAYRATHFLQWYSTYQMGLAY